MKQFIPSVAYLLALVIIVALTATRTATAFGVVPKTATCPRSGERMRLCMSTQSGETEVERLLRMARELRAQAEESEKEVSEKQADKKADKEARLGGLLNHLFYDGTKGEDVGRPETIINDRTVVVEKLRSKNPSVETLEQFVDWMDDRRDNALGYAHVESDGSGKFKSVSGQANEAEANRLFELTERLLDALEVIDGEQHNKNNGHLGGGNHAADLRQRLREKRRERDAQFLERQNSFVEAQTIKKGKSKYEYHDEFLDDLD